MADRTPNRLDVSPIRRERNRQFSQIRQGHSQRPATSQATSRLTETPQQPKHSENKKTPTQNRVSKADNIKLDNSKVDPSKPQLSHSPTKTLCVGCFNKQMFQAKQKKKREEDHSFRERTNLSLINPHDEAHNQARSRHHKEIEQTNNYNREKMLKDKEKRNQEKSERDRTISEMKKSVQDSKLEQRQKAERQHERMEQLRRQLQQQIQIKKQKDQEYKQSLKQTPLPMFGQANRQGLQQKIEQKYRKDLKNQIEQNRHLKSLQFEEQEKRKKDFELKAIEEATQKERTRREEIERRQKIIEDEAKKHRQFQQIQQERKKQQEAEQEAEAKENFNAYIEEKKKMEELKRKRLDRYVDDLKVQMAVDQAKKKREYAWMNEPTRIALIDRETLPERRCDSCEKNYPEPYLTKLGDGIKF